MNSTPLEVKVIGANCETCGKLYDYTLEAVGRLNLNAQVIQVNDLLEIVKMGIMSVPALMVNGKLLVSGQAVKTDKIIKLLQKNGFC